MLGKALDWTADPPGVAAEPLLRACTTLVLAHWVVQAWVWVIDPPPVPFVVPPWLGWSVAVGLTLCAAASFSRYARRAALAGALLSLVLVVWTLPGTANHTLLACLLLFLLAGFDAGDAEEAALLLQSLRWVVIIVFFYAGLQKVLHGLYFRGEFLTWMVAHGVGRWADVFGWMIPAEEVARVRSLPRYLIDGGPYRLDAPLFVVAANVVWIGEIALAVGLCIARIRHWAALGALVLVFFLQLAPREFMFALLYSQLLLLFVPGEWERKLLPVYLLAYAWLLAVLLGAPGDFLIRASGDV